MQLFKTTSHYIGTLPDEFRNPFTITKFFNSVYASFAIRIRNLGYLNSSNKIEKVDRKMRIISEILSV